MGTLKGKVALVAAQGISARLSWWWGDIFSNKRADLVDSRVANQGAMRVRVACDQERKPMFDIALIEQDHPLLGGPQKIAGLETQAER